MLIKKDPANFAAFISSRHSARVSLIKDFRKKDQIRQNLHTRWIEILLQLVPSRIAFGLSRAGLIAHSPCRDFQKNYLERRRTYARSRLFFPWSISSSLQDRPRSGTGRVLSRGWIAILSRDPPVAWISNVLQHVSQSDSAACSVVPRHRS